MPQCTNCKNDIPEGQPVVTDEAARPYCSVYCVKETQAVETGDFAALETYIAKTTRLTA